MSEEEKKVASNVDADQRQEQSEHTPDSFFAFISFPEQDKPK